MQKLKKNDLYIGQRLFFVPSDTRDTPETTEVIKIGRKYITLKHGYYIEIGYLEERFVMIKDYGNRGNFYLSEDEYKKALSDKELVLAIRELCTHSTAQAPLALEKIKELIKENDNDNYKRA